jgi:hypothetical protein
MEAASSSEMSVAFYQAVHSHIPQDNHLHIQRTVFFSAPRSLENKCSKISAARTASIFRVSDSGSRGCWRDWEQCSVSVIWESLRKYNETRATGGGGDNDRASSEPIAVEFQEWPFERPAVENNKVHTIAMKHQISNTVSLHTTPIN